MAITNKLKNSVFIITVSFYVFLLLIPSFVLKDFAGADIYVTFFFNRNLNILLCLVPAALGIFFSKKNIVNNTLTLAVIDTLILFLIFAEFFVSANYYLNLLTAIFILFFILININELFSLAGIIPFFFLSDLDIFHYVLIVAVPLILLLLIKLNHTQNKIKKTAMRITLFIQCYICVFFIAILVTDIYWLYINTSLPQYVTAEYIIKTVITIILLLFVSVCYIINVFRHSQKVKDKLIFTVSAIIPLCTGLAGYFTDILSTVNKTSVLIGLIYIIIFNTQYGLSAPTEQKHNSGGADIITVISAILFCLSMIN